MTFMYLKIFFFFCGPFLKSLLNLLQYCFCFMFWVFGPQVCGVLVPQPVIEPAPLVLEGEVLTPRLPGKSLSQLLKSGSFSSAKW